MAHSHIWILSPTTDAKWATVISVSYCKLQYRHDVVLLTETATSGLVVCIQWKTCIDWPVLVEDEEEFRVDTRRLFAAATNRFRWSVRPTWHTGRHTDIQTDRQRDKTGCDTEFKCHNDPIYTNFSNIKNLILYVDSLAIAERYGDNENTVHHIISPGWIYRLPVNIHDFQEGFNIPGDFKDFHKL